jgi:adenine deaminase
MALIFTRTNPFTTSSTYMLKEEIYADLLSPYSVSGRIVDVVNRRIFSGRIYVNALGHIEKIAEEDNVEERYLMPGFVDSHVHVESSMLMPSEFARAAVRSGAVAAMCDPHEIANVLGIDGLNYFMDNGRRSGFRFFFGAPSCVPATGVDTAGAIIDAAEVRRLIRRDDIWFLGEMMNFPGVVSGDMEVISKIDSARIALKPIDGHAPGLSGAALETYVRAGISTDHECFDLHEAEEKLSLGMKIQIREGSAAKNLNALLPLVDRYPEAVMLCTDDMHPDDLLDGYMATTVRKALAGGTDFFNVMRAVSLNPVAHYNVPVGLLRTGDHADFIITDSIGQNFNVLKTYIAGKEVFDSSENAVRMPRPGIVPKNNFRARKYSAEDIRVEARGKMIKVIGLTDGEIVTRSLVESATIIDGFAVASPEKDILKIAVINRYRDKAKPATGFIKGFGLKQGALCTTVAHDSHNIIAVGIDDESIIRAVNAVVETSGGIAVYDGKDVDILPLPVAGILCAGNAEQTAASYKRLQNKAKAAGATLSSPFMALAFMALVVIPHLKLHDRGLFNVDTFRFTELWE